MSIELSTVAIIASIVSAGFAWVTLRNSERGTVTLKSVPSASGRPTRR